MKQKNNFLSTSKRKDEHIKICLDKKNKNVYSEKSPFDEYKFVHNALPEINFDEISTETVFLKKKISIPLLISSMTGGGRSENINKNLAIAAEKKNVALGLGSMRVVFESPETLLSFDVRKYAPNVALLANIGAVNLNYGFGTKECLAAQKSIGADALILHLNPLQEALQPEGQRNFKGLLKKLSKIKKELKFPIIVKEVGAGISSDVAEKLIDAGIKYIDVAGQGGTSWAKIEGIRAKTGGEDMFFDWGIPTTQSIIECEKVCKKNGVVLIASGGIRSGLDMAKAIALGADYCSIALPFLEPALKSPKAVEELIDQLTNELKIAMFCIGAKNISELKDKGRKAIVKNCTC